MDKKHYAAIVAAVILLPMAVYIVLRIWRVDQPESIDSLLAENGFVAVKPPSTLLAPGTWVIVNGRNPLHLGVVCTPANALGLTDPGSVLNSPSIDTELTSRLQDTFVLDTEALGDLNGSVSFEEIREVSLQLKDIRILEVSDDTVVAGIPARSLHCRDAILFRIEEQFEVSMVKSVLIADADYQMTFQNDLSGEAAARLRKEFALAMDLRLGTSQSGEETVIGNDLVWGIRDDSALARIGLGLPATGGGQATVQALDSSECIGDVRFSLTEYVDRGDAPTAISFDVPPMRQSSAMSCWATVYSMMRAWRDGEAHAPNAIVAELGEPWDEYYVRDAGLPGGEEKLFVEEVGMESEPPANYLPEAYAEMLREFGPLWIITGDGISAHARLLVGLYGDPGAGGIEAYENTTFEFIDPLTGSYQYESGLDFAMHFEQEARWLVDGRFDDIELRDQILHWPRPDSE